MTHGETGKVEEGGAVDHSWQFINSRFKDCYSGSTEPIRICPVQPLKWLLAICVSIHSCSRCFFLKHGLFIGPVALYIFTSTPAVILRTEDVSITFNFQLKSAPHQSNGDFEGIHVKFMFNWKALEGAAGK